MFKQLLTALSLAAVLGIIAPVHAADAKPKETQMKETIAVIGTGRMGGAFGARFAALGHPVVYGSREPGKAAVREVVGKTGGDARALTPKEAAAAAQIIVLAVPWSGIADTVQLLGDVSGKIVMDATNALKSGAGGMEMAVPSSAGEMIQAWLPQAKVVKAFNTVGFFVIADPKAMDGTVAVFLAGEDAAAKTRVGQLVTELGFQPVDVGGIKNSRVLESMSILYMVPYMSGKREQAFEWAVRSTGARVGGPVRPAQ